MIRQEIAAEERVAKLTPAFAALVHTPRARRSRLDPAAPARLLLRGRAHGRDRPRPCASDLELLPRAGARLRRSRLRAGAGTRRPISARASSRATGPRSGRLPLAHRDRRPSGARQQVGGIFINETHPSRWPRTCAEPSPPVVHIRSLSANRGAPRLRRGATSVGGEARAASPGRDERWGEAATACRGATRRWGVWGAIRGPPCI